MLEPAVILRVALVGSMARDGAQRVPARAHQVLIELVVGHGGGREPVGLGAASCLSARITSALSAVPSGALMLHQHEEVLATSRVTPPYAHQRSLGAP